MKQAERIKVLIGTHPRNLSIEGQLARIEYHKHLAADHAKHKQQMRQYYAEHPEAAAHCPWYLKGAK